MKMSLGYKVSKVFFHFCNYKRPFRNEKTFERYLRKHDRRYKPLYPSINRIAFEVKRINEMDYYDINSQAERIVFFIPGGSFIDHPNDTHWMFVKRIVNECNVRVIMPIYPKLPKASYVDCYSGLKALYDNLDSKMILLADSAGALLGLGMALDNYLFEKMILISPWVDVRMNNPLMAEYEKVDPVLSIVGLRRLGRMWSHNDVNYLTCPILGDLGALKNLYVFAGTHEIFLPDIREMLLKCHNAYYYEGENMNHGFVFHPIKEAKEPSQFIIDLILKEEE